MTQYIADEAHFKEVIARVANSFGNTYRQYAPIPTDPLRPAYWNTP